MSKFLNKKQQQWVEATFSSMTMEEKVASLLHPSRRGGSAEEIAELLQKIPFGSLFISGKHCNTMEETRAFAKVVQKAAKIPLLISGDQEHGAIMMTDTSHFTYPMGVAATGNTDYAYEMGRITAHECRPNGVHWTFSPVADLNLNPDNPITNVRAFGDDPDKVIPHLLRMVEGLQENGMMAACCKHFPGDGVDDRDQHMVTSVNTLPFDQWMELYGKVWKTMIDAGLMSIMAGHIALPSYTHEIPDEALPATLNRKLQIDLLRNELGFEGVLVSDAAAMIGICSRVKADDQAWQNIESGSDSYLFADPVKDFELLKKALKDGRLSELRVEESAKRILEMKARLNLFEDCFGAVVSDEQLKQHKAIADEEAEKSVTMLREAPGRLPVKSPNKKILTVSLVREGSVLPFEDLEEVDSELKKRGFDVTHVKNPSDELLMEALDTYDVIFCNILTVAHAGIMLRLTGKAALPFWRGFFAQKPEKVIFTSFGSPYIFHELPAIDNLLCVWSMRPVAQRAAVKAWLGEIPVEGTCPVCLPKTRIRRWEFQD
ncbi:MAG: hypothetical protein IJW23_06565 [Lentisphaeria bacterium]|nr:hypothetical protein [Lentisphaeria bacterium]